MPIRGPDCLPFDKQNDQPRNAANFGVIQMAVSLLLITFFIAVAIFWQYLVAWFSDWRARRAVRRSRAHR
jgi:hypothetical protein